MKITATVKFFVGLATTWFLLYPLLFLVIFIVGFVSDFFISSRPSQADPILPYSLIGGVFILLHCSTILLGFGLDAFYLIHVIKNTTASETARILFGIGIFFLPFIAMPVYYYLYIWLEKPPEWALEQGNRALPG
jgi:hypothetical protein